MKTMNFFEKTKKLIKDSYQKGAEFSSDINKIKQKSQAEKIKVLRQKNVIARQQTQLAHQKALQNKYKQQGGGGVFGGGGGNLNALLGSSSQTQSKASFGNDFNPGGGLAAVLGNGSKSKKKRPGSGFSWL